MTGLLQRTMIDDSDYFDSLIRRKRAGLWYRNLWLYPRICMHLRGQVLDVGCGIGDMVRFRPETIGVDVNPRAVAYCQSLGVKVRQMQPDLLPFADGEFDGAVLDNVLEHLENPESLLAEIRRVLRTGGSFVVGVPGERGFASDLDHKRHYPETALIRCIYSAGFEPQTVFHQPFRSRLLDRHFRYYAIYGVFRRS
jgi:SAM-dependent methyltransferase